MNSNIITNLDLASINYIFAKPYKQGYYTYSINNVENFSLIPKEELFNLILKIGYIDKEEQLQYFLDRYLPFLFFSETKEVKGFKLTNEAPSKMEINQLLKKEIHSKVDHPILSFKEKHIKKFNPLSEFYS